MTDETVTTSVVDVKSAVVQAEEAIGNTGTLPLGTTVHTRIQLWISTFEKRAQNGISKAIEDADAAVKAFENYFHKL